MYTNLEINTFKHYCLLEYVEYKNQLKLPYNFTVLQFKTLLNLCLDYNYVEHDKLFYKQRKGIAMGNVASVSVANITANCELSKLFVNKSRNSIPC